MASPACVKEVRVCETTGKIKYRSNGDAAGWAAHYLSSPKLRFSQNLPDKLRPYRCPDCGTWHLTKSARRG
jgi:hypothetical protein